MSGQQQTSPTAVSEFGDSGGFVAAPGSEAVRRFRWNNIAGVTLVHLLAGLAAFPWFFSWTGVILALAGIFIFGTLGINVGYHRLLTHRSFSTPRWLERTLVMLGVCCAQES